LIKHQKENKDNIRHQPLTLKKYKNCVYFGPTLNGKKEGEGVLHYFNGKFYEGTFIDDQKIHGL
jgi:hypothetical protein